MVNLSAFKAPGPEVPAVRREAEPGDSARRHRILAGVVAGISRLGARPPDGRAGGLMMGLGLGLLFVPCAGPVLAAITVAGLIAMALALGSRTFAGLQRAVPG